VKKKTTKSIT